MKKEGHEEGIKSSIDSIIGVDTTLKRRKKSEDDFLKEKFCKVIKLLEEVDVRSSILEKDLNLGFTKYDEKFYLIIDSLLEMNFGKEASELIFFYIYDRINPDGSINELMDEFGNTVTLQSPQDLYILIKAVQEKVKRAK